MDELTDDQDQASSRNQQLAARLFGSEYHGTIEEGPADAAPVDGSMEDEAPETHLADASEAESADVSSSEDGVAQSEQESDETEYVATFAEFIEAEGLDSEFVDGLTVSLKINGEIVEKPFSEIRAAAQMNMAADDALESAKQIKRSAQEADRSNRQQFDQAIQVATEIAGRSLKAVQAEQQALDASGLRDTDPAEYAARKLSLQEKLESEKAQILRIAKSVQDENARRQAQTEQETQQQLAEGAEQLVKAIPAWSNPEVAKSDAEAVVAYVSKSGLFSEQQVRENTIPGLWVLAHKARLYDELQGATDVTAKRLRRVPKVAKPGAPKTPEQHNQSQAAQARKDIRRATGTNAQIAAAVRANQLSRRT